MESTPTWLKALAIMGIVAIALLAVVVVSPHVKPLQPIAKSLGLVQVKTQVETIYVPVNHTVYVNQTIVKYVNATCPGASLTHAANLSDYVGTELLVGDATLYVYASNNTARLVMPVYIPPAIMRYLSMNETWEINGPEQPGMLQYGNAALGVSFNLMNMLIFYPNSTLMAERMSWLTPQVCSGNFFAGAVTRLFWSNGEYQYAYAYFYVNVTGDEAYIVGYPTIITSNFIEKGYVTVMGQPCYTNPIGPLFNGTAYPVAFEVNLDMPYSQVTSLPYTWYWWYVGNMTVIIIK